MVQMRIKASQQLPRPKPAVTSHESLAAQINDYLHAGGCIQQIDRGVSGQGKTINRHISISQR